MAKFPVKVIPEEKLSLNSAIGSFNGKTSQRNNSRKYETPPSSFPKNVFVA